MRITANVMIAAAVPSVLERFTVDARYDLHRSVGDSRVMHGDPHADTLRGMADHFRQRYPSGVVILASATEGRPTLIAAVTEDLVRRGLHAGELAKAAAAPLGGSGGGRPTLAQAGGKDASRLSEALDQARAYVQKKLA